MGMGFSKPLPPGRIIMVGLDAAGKSTLLYKMRCSEVTTSIPTIGFNFESVFSKQLDLLAWDIGGRSPMRPLWRHYMRDTQGVVFVVDSSDRERIQQASEELAKLMSEDELGNCPLLLMANKKDLPNAMPLVGLLDAMKLQHMQRQRPFAAFSVCATTFEGASEAFEWLACEIKRSGGRGIQTPGKLEVATDSSSGSNKLHHLAESLLPKSLLKFLYA